MRLKYLFAAVCMLFVVGCDYIAPGYVGIKVNSWGTQKGVDDYPVYSGRVLYNPFTESVHEFPVFMQNITWEKAGAIDQSISFNSKEGAILSADVGLSFTLDSEKVPHLFVEFRKDIDDITKMYLRNKVRDTINNEASKHSATEIFGSGRQLILTNVKKSLDSELRDKGFIIDNVTFTNEVRADERVRASVNSVIEASQRALEAEQKVKQVTAEAEQEVAKSKGLSAAILQKAEADAKANEVLTKSLSPELIKYKALEKWDGRLPQFSGGTGAVPFVNVDTLDK